MRGVVVQNEMDLQRGGDFLIDSFEELNPFLMRMALRAVRENFAFQIIKYCK